MLDPLVLTVVSVAFGLLLLLGAVHKLTALDEFRLILADYRLLPAGMVPAAAIGIGLVEAAIGAAWLFAPGKALAAVATATVLLLYALGIAINLGRGRTHISCGCSFGRSAGGNDLLSWGLVVRNLVLVIVAGAALLPAGPRSLGSLDFFTLAATLLIAVLLFAASNQLIRNRAAIRAWRRPVTRDD